MRELQAQVVALQQALKARVPPNSLAAIIEASKPKPEETAQVQVRGDQSHEAPAESCVVAGVNVAPC